MGYSRPRASVNGQWFLRDKKKLEWDRAFSQLAWGEFPGEEGDPAGARGIPGVEWLELSVQEDQQQGPWVPRTEQQEGENYTEWEYRRSQESFDQELNSVIDQHIPMRKLPKYIWIGFEVTVLGDWDVWKLFPFSSARLENPLGTGHWLGNEE